MPERSGTPAEDPFSGRTPTSHERMTGLPWDASYHEGLAPWDTGQPQPAVVRLASEGGFAGSVLDAGCGTGENALHVACLGLPVLGVDVAETALAIAAAKAADRGIKVDFAAADALKLERLGRRFDTVLDCGLFHTFDGSERPRYVASLASVTGHHGTLYLLCSPAVSSPLPIRSTPSTRPCHSSVSRSRRCTSMESATCASRRHRTTPQMTMIGWPTPSGNYWTDMPNNLPATPGSGPVTSSGQWPRRAEPTGRTPPGR